MTVSRHLYVLTLLRTLLSFGGAEFCLLRRSLVGTGLVVVVCEWVHGTGYLCVQIEILPCFVLATVVDNRSSSSYDVSEHCPGCMFMTLLYYVRYRSEKDQESRLRTKIAEVRFLDTATA
jgi:hypothetical protein